MEKRLLGSFTQLLGISPQTSNFRATSTSLQRDGKERTVQKARPERAPPPLVTVQVPGAAYLAGLVPAWANVPFKADGLVPQFKEFFKHFLKKKWGCGMNVSSCQVLQCGKSHGFCVGSPCVNFCASRYLLVCKTRPGLGTRSISCQKGTLVTKPAFPGMFHRASEQRGLAEFVSSAVFCKVH